MERMVFDVSPCKLHRVGRRGLRLDVLHGGKLRPLDPRLPGRRKTRIVGEGQAIHRAAVRAAAEHDRALARLNVELAVEFRPGPLFGRRGNERDRSCPPLARANRAPLRALDARPDFTRAVDFRQVHGEGCTSLALVSPHPEIVEVRCPSLEGEPHLRIAYRLVRLNEYVPLDARRVADSRLVAQATFQAGMFHRRDGVEHRRAGRYRVVEHLQRLDRAFG